MVTTTERVETVRRYIAERRKLANDLRGSALGADVSTAQRNLQEAIVCESIATGMERALLILFP